MDSRLVAKHYKESVTQFWGILLLEGALVIFFLWVLYLPLSFLLFSSLSLSFAGLDIRPVLLLHVLKISFFQAFLSTLVSGSLGVFLALAYVDSGLKIAKVFWALSLVCFSMPVLILCLALISFWGKSGWVGSLLHSLLGFEFYGWFAVLCAHTFMNFPIFFRGIAERFVNEGRLHEKTALTLGASRVQTFFLVTWPKIRSVVRGSALLVFVYCFTSFLVVLLLGGGPRFTTLEVLIYQAIRLDQDLQMAGVLSGFQLVFCLTAVRFIPKAPIQELKGEKSDYAVYCCRAHSSRLAVFLLLIAFLMFLTGPLVSLIIDGCAAYVSVLTAEVARVTLRGLCFSMSVGATSVGIGTSIAYVLSRSKSKTVALFFRLSTSLPLVFSTLLLSMALLRFYGTFEVFRQTLLGPFLIQVLVALPLIVPILKAAIDRIPRDLLRVSSSLGAQPWQRFLWLELPFLKTSLQLVFVLSVCVSLGEVGSLLMFAVGGESLLSMWIYRQMGRYHFQEAAAGAVLLLAILFIFSKGLAPERREND